MLIDARRVGSGIAMLLGLSLPASAATFQGLGAPVGGNSRAFALSEDGSVVTGAWFSEGQDRAFIWDRVNGLNLLPTEPSLPGLDWATAVSAGGEVVVGQGGDIALRWSADFGKEVLGQLPSDPNSIFPMTSFADDVSRDGSVVVGASSSGQGIEAFRWVAFEGLTGLGDLVGGDLASYARAVSSDGAVVVGSGENDLGQAAVRWVNGSAPVLLAGPSDPFALVSAYDVTPDGTVIVGGDSNSPLFIDVSNVGPFRWTESGGAQALGSLTSPLNGYELTSGYAVGVSDDGDTIIGAVFPDSDPGGATPFVWSATHGMRSLRDALIDAGLADDIDGWDLVSAARVYGVSADGLTFAGSARNPSGQIEAWVATIPEPGGFLSVAVILGCSFVVRRKA